MRSTKKELLTSTTSRLPKVPSTSKTLLHGVCLRFRKANPTSSPRPLKKTSAPATNALIFLGTPLILSFIKVTSSRLRTSSRTLPCSTTVACAWSKWPTSSRTCNCSTAPFLTSMYSTSPTILQSAVCTILTPQQLSIRSGALPTLKSVGVASCVASAPTTSSLPTLNSFSFGY